MLSSQQLDRIFSALADPTRRAIVARLSNGTASAGALAAPFRMSLPAVTKHLKVLEKAGLLQRHIDGRVHRCRLSVKPMDDATAWIERHKQFWNRQFGALAAYLASEPASSKPKRKRKSRRS